MAHAKIKLYDVTSSSYTEEYDIFCSGITIGFSNNTVASPMANGGSVVEVQKQSFNNPLYTLSGVIINEEGTSLTYAKLLEYAKMNNYKGGNYLVLDIDYGISSTKQLPDSNNELNGIKVVLKSYNISLGLDSSNNIRAGSGNIVLQETA